MTAPLDATAPRSRATGFHCPNCGASISMSTQGWAVTVACPSCASVLDAQHPQFKVLQQHQAQITVTPSIPLGTRGTWGGAPWEVVGFQQVTITVEGVNYSWTEYVCFNPFRGFMYLSEYMGHWNVIEKLRRRPSGDAMNDGPVTLDGATYKHFQTSQAYTTFALGEFPWEVNVGDSVTARDFVSPPFLLSAESTEDETTWSRGMYTPSDVIAKAFGLKGKLRDPVGVFANQPNPNREKARAVARLYKLFLLVLVAVFATNMALARREQVFSGAFSFDHDRGDSAAVFVTEPFELKGRRSNVELAIESNVDNNWAFFGLALINDETGQAFDVGREVSYYHGRDSDGSWTEGSGDDRATIASVPSGRYILRVAPEGGEAGKPPVSYRLKVRRDVPSYLFYLLAFLALSIPAALAWFPVAGFEQRRWAESDHAPAASSSSDDDDDS